LHRFSVGNLTIVCQANTVIGLAVFNNVE